MHGNKIKKIIIRACLVPPKMPKKLGFGLLFCILELNTPVKMAKRWFVGDPKLWPCLVSKKFYKLF